MDADTPANALGPAPFKELRICPKCQQQRLRRKGSVAVLPLGRYRCQHCKAEMVLPLRFQGGNRARYVLSVLLIGGISAALAFGINDLFGGMPYDAPTVTESLDLPDPQARQERFSAPAAVAQGDLVDATGTATANEVQITPALAPQAVLPSAGTQPGNSLSLAGAEPQSAALAEPATDNTPRSSTLPMPSLRANPVIQPEENAVASVVPAAKPGAKLSTALPVSLAPQSLAPPAPAPALLPPPPPEPPKAKVVASLSAAPSATSAAAASDAKDARPKSLFAPVPASAAANSPAPEAAALASPEPAALEPKPASTREADFTLKNLAVSTRNQATRITLTTSAPSEAIRLSELPAQNAYVVDFPGDWAIGPGVARSLRPSDAKLLRVEVKQTANYLRLVLYCVADVINQPLVVADGDGFTITVQ